LAPPSPDFTGWLQKVISHRRRQTPEQVQTDIRTGLAECLRFGTTLVGDISGDGSSWDVLANAPLRAIVFRELLGLSGERVREVWLTVLRWGREASATATCRPGVSPHAPYSVNAAVIRAVAWNGWPTAIHLAESASERELLERHSGPFVS